jgi:hypothetical protein
MIKQCKFLYIYIVLSSFCSLIMGKRKLRLSSRKNYERKKYQKRLLMVHGPHGSMCDANVTKLVVCLPQSAYLSAPVSSFHLLCERMRKSENILNNGWNCTGVSNHVLQKSFSSYNVSIKIMPDFSFVLEVGGYHLNADCTQFPITYINSIEILLKLLSMIDTSSLCKGNADEKFENTSKRRNGKFLDRAGNPVAYYDLRHLPLPTIRHRNCTVFVRNDTMRCHACEDYRPYLHSFATREKKRTLESATSATSSMNYRYLTSPEKMARLQTTKKETRALRMQLKRLEKKLSDALENDGVVLDDELSKDITTIINEVDSRVQHEHKEDTFQYIFWKQQREAMGKEGAEKNGIRWHPLIIKWCLYLRHQSNKAYNTLRDSGCIALPSTRTLRDYSHAIKAGAGFSAEVDQQLFSVAKLKSNPKYHSLIAILIDEMTIKEDLVYDKHTGRLVGFINLGHINNHLLRFEQSLTKEEEPNDPDPVLAKSMIVFMVKGLFTNLRFPYVQLPCTSIAGEQIFSPFWKAVCHLERMGFKVYIHKLKGYMIQK